MADARILKVSRFSQKKYIYLREYIIPSWRSTLLHPTNINLDFIFLYFISADSCGSKYRMHCWSDFSSRFTWNSLSLTHTHTLSTPLAFTLSVIAAKTWTEYFPLCRLYECSCVFERKKNIWRIPAFSTDAKISLTRSLLVSHPLCAILHGWLLGTSIYIWKCSKSNSV